MEMWIAKEYKIAVIALNVMTQHGVITQQGMEKNYE
jgi:hypothetical protein